GSARASAFLTSCLTNDVRFGYRVISHLRLRSVPGRLRLSRRVTCQPSLIRCAAAFTPRNPAPPVMRMRRPGLSVSGSSLSVTYRAFGSMVPPTLSRRYAPEERTPYDPLGDREVAGVGGGPPQDENHREHHEDASAVSVEKGQDVEPADDSQLRLETGDLLAEVIDRQSQALLELDLRTPSEMLGGARVVERDPVHIALARRAEPGLEPVLGQEGELAK